MILSYHTAATFQIVPGLAATTLRLIRAVRASASALLTSARTIIQPIPRATIRAICRITSITVSIALAAGLSRRVIPILRCAI